MYYDLFDHDTSTSFCGIYDITDLESRLEVIRGSWFWHQPKAHIWLPIGLQ